MMYQYTTAVQNIHFHPRYHLKIPGHYNTVYIYRRQKWTVMCMFICTYIYISMNWEKKAFFNQVSSFIFQIIEELKRKTITKGILNISFDPSTRGFHGDVFNVVAKSGNLPLKASKTVIKNWFLNLIRNAKITYLLLKNDDFFF